MEQNQNKKTGLYFQTQIWYSTLVGPKTFVEPNSNPKNSLKGPKKGKKLGQIRDKKIGLRF